MGLRDEWYSLFGAEKNNLFEVAYRHSQILILAQRRIMDGMNFSYWAPLFNWFFEILANSYRHETFGLVRSDDLQQLSSLKLYTCKALDIFSSG